ncbi:hypothetical protein Tco_1381598, partial [Tanacetum coccineum]
MPIILEVQCKSELLHILHHPSHQLLLSTSEETVATCLDHIVGAKAKCMSRIASADVLPTIGLAEAPLSHNHVKYPQTQDNSTKDDPSDRGSKLDPEGVAKGRDATMN